MEIVLWILGILGIGMVLWAIKALRTPVPDAPTQTQTSRVISNPPISSHQSVSRGQRTASQLSPRELQRKRDEKRREDERQRRDWDDDDDGLGVVGVAVLADNDWGNTRSDPTPVRDDSIVAPSAQVSARVEAYEPPTRSEPVYEAPSRSYDSSPSYSSSSSDSGSSYSSDSGGSSSSYSSSDSSSSSSDSGSSSSD